MSVEGIPEGWELVRIGTPVLGEYLLGKYGKILQCAGVFKGVSYVIIRKIKKPNKYRPFANAAEFEPHRDRWWKTNGNDRVNPPAYYNDSYHGGLSFDMCFINRTFDDGTPFGVEVTE